MSRVIVAAAAFSLLATAVACSGPADAPPIAAPAPSAAATTPAASASVPISTTPTTPPTELPPLTTSDGGTTPPATGSCVPATAVTPAAKVWKQPHALRLNVCTAQEAAAIVQCFISKQNCDALVTQACHACAVSGDATPYASALIVNAQGQPAELNVEGCVANMTGDPSANGCGPKLAARFECANQACTACTDETQRQSCLSQADTGVCATTATNASCATPYLTQCVQGTTELDVAYNLVRLFCGP